MKKTRIVTKPLSDLMESLENCCECGDKEECVICSIRTTLDEIYTKADMLELNYDALLKLSERGE